ncbi:hypothetical protein D7223_26350 [Micromonospora endolithica]|uniref:Uncharacterized protein n=1 Tax=Micromonospora endolithica TaxID=230091 RepID=A0A3A9YXJ8_9ACTN|nr:hypothetical protein D7223_26350 [Micromonospora endolithica]
MVRQRCPAAGGDPAAGCRRRVGPATGVSLPGGGDRFRRNGAVRGRSVRGGRGARRTGGLGRAEPGPGPGPPGRRRPRGGRARPDGGRGHGPR